MSKSNKVAKVRQVYYIQAPVAKVFDAITNPKILSKWFLKSATLDQKKGGTYRFTALTHNDTQKGNVLEFKKNEKLTIDWTKWADGTKVTFTTKKAGKNTLLTVLHVGFKNEESRVGHAVGWTYYLMNLKSVLESGKDLRSVRDVLL